MADIEEMCKKILSMKGVLGFIILNTDGCSIKTSFDAATTTNYVTKIHQLVSAVRNSLHELDPTNDLSFLRIRSKKHELLIAPDKEYMLIVIQQPSVSK